MIFTNPDVEFIKVHEGPHDCKIIESKIIATGKLQFHVDAGRTNIAIEDSMEAALDAVKEWFGD